MSRLVLTARMRIQGVSARVDRSAISPIMSLERGIRMPLAEEESLNNYGRAGIRPSCAICLPPSRHAKVAKLGKLTIAVLG